MVNNTVVIKKRDMQILLILFQQSHPIRYADNELRK